MIAYPAAYRRERVSFPYQVHCLQVLFLLNELDIALDIDIGRAGHLARRVTIFQNIEDVWRSLSILFGNRFARAQVAVEVVMNTHRRGRGTLVAGGAFFLAHIAGVDFNRSLKIAWFALQFY